VVLGKTVGCWQLLVVVLVVLVGLSWFCSDGGFTCCLLVICLFLEFFGDQDFVSLNNTNRLCSVVINVVVVNEHWLWYLFVGELFFVVLLVLFITICEYPVSRAFSGTV
jgi:hypothetical protein